MSVCLSPFRPALHSGNNELLFSSVAANQTGLQERSTLWGQGRALAHAFLICCTLSNTLSNFLTHVPSV